MAIWAAAILVLRKGGICEVCCWTCLDIVWFSYHNGSIYSVRLSDGLRRHDIHPKFYNDRLRQSSNIKVISPAKSAVLILKQRAVTRLRHSKQVISLTMIAHSTEEHVRGDVMQCVAAGNCVLHGVRATASDATTELLGGVFGPCRHVISRTSL
jgi:hypothetical protein